MMRLILAFVLVAFYSFPGHLLAGDGTCSNKTRVCVEGPETRMISGYPVTRDCWKYESKYDCISQNYVDECTPLVDKGCAQIGSQCVDYLDSDPSKCSLYEQTYQCKVADGASKTVTDCGGQSFCMDGLCFDAGYTPDGDFGIAMTGMEAVRQAGNYLDPDSMTLFNGIGSQCRVTLGIFNCCKKDTKGATQNNSSLMVTLGIDAAKSIGGETISYLGSTYMYDALFQSDAPNMLISGMSGLLGGSGSSYAFTPSVSYFGLTVGYGSVAVGAPVSSLVGTTTVFASGATAAAPGFYLAFNPVTFVIAIVIYIIMELISCEQDEQVLSMKRGQNLCAYVGTYCSSKVLGVCVQKKQSHCCFNSRIARLIAVGGRAQLGKSWGSPKTPDCGGLTPAEIQRVDFSLIDFSEVVSDIKASVKIPDYAIDRATQKMESYYTQ